MTEVLFYHLERTVTERVLPGLLEKSLERGWKAIVRCADAEELTRIDEKLWTYTDESFLAHSATQEEEDAAMQPVWLTADDRNPNGAEILFLVHGAEADPKKLGDYARCVMIFDGHNEEALAQARGFWKSVKAADLPATYWKQSEAGRWEKQG